ncbi:MAG: endonuclease domain-containing protein, partial [Bacteroidia bacterium]
MTKEINNHYNIKLKPLARNHRNDSTKAEIRLWCELLRAKQLGYSFLRQRSIGNYIVDFFSKELNLIIEVDGITHRHEENFKKDIKREIELKSLGYKILRFSDEEV